VLFIVFAVVFVFSDEVGSGGVRNCIKSVMRDYPSCSDDDGTVKDTYLNGEYVGACHCTDNVGNCY